MNFFNNFIDYIKQAYEHAFSGNMSIAVKHALEPELVSFFGIMVNPSFYTTLIVAGILILAALIIRTFVIPKFKTIPGKFQSILELMISYFEKSSKTQVHKHAGIIGPYTCITAVFIALSTLIELFGIRPAFADINTCFAFGLSTFFLIHYCGVREHGIGGRLKRYINPINLLTDISIPLSLSLRLFGSIMSGFIIMELVYSSIATSIITPALVSIITTFFHAGIQAFLFATLTNIFVGEAVEIHH